MIIVDVPVSLCSMLIVIFFLKNVKLGKDARIE
jgi:hypothetical protein